jgi:N-acetyl-gamma-glutamyl-phosphate reductase
MLKVGIVGVTGYTGQELYAILKNHPKVVVTHLYSQTYKDQYLQDIFPHLSGALKLEGFNAEKLADDIDLLFLALPHGVTHALMPALIKHKIKIIDFSADFRLQDLEIFYKYYQIKHAAPALLKEFVLGYPEFDKDCIKKAKYIANPGCYSAASIYGLYPLAKEKVLVNNQIYIDAKSGLSGAGKALKEGSLFCEVNESVKAYNTGQHRHIAEIEEKIGFQVVFSPHLVPMNRGILASIYGRVEKKMTQDKLVNMYQKFYEKEVFIQINTDFSKISTKYTNDSNNCVIWPQMMDEQNFAIFVAIDNLGKGAAGQAVQNMNLMMNYAENLGLAQLSRLV